MTPGGEPTGIQGPRVVIAQGTERVDLAQLSEALDAHSVTFEVNEDPSGESGVGWQVIIPIGEVMRARGAVADLTRARERAEGHEMVGSVGSPPPPIDSPSHGNLLRLVLMALCFGLALWLALSGLGG